VDPFDILFSFKGRLNRKPFWLYQLGVAVVTSIPFLLGHGWLTGLLELWVQAALCVKRAHDGPDPLPSSSEMEQLNP
jgi:uncharacterized membrane protein YhaH (DUF805 family)